MVSRITDPLSSDPVNKGEVRQPCSPQRIEALKRESALSQMTLNRMNKVVPTPHQSPALMKWATLQAAIY